MRKHTCHFDFRQRSLYVTIGKKNWVQKFDRQPQEEVARQAKFFQPTQSIPKPICDRSGQLDNKHEVFVDKGETSRSQEIKVKSFHEELCSSDRSGQPDITPRLIRAHNNLSEDIRAEQTHDRSGQPDKLKSNDKMPLKYIVRLRFSTPTMS